MLYGPNTNLAHNSIVYMIESQIRYVITCLTRLYRDEIRSIEIKEECAGPLQREDPAPPATDVVVEGLHQLVPYRRRHHCCELAGLLVRIQAGTRAPKWDDYAVQ